MPIKGLTRRLPRVGKIHLGVMDQNAKGVKYPKAVDHFVFPPEHPQYDELVAMFGDRPKELRIVFPLDEEGKFASQFYRCYSKSRGLICKGDGEIALRMVDARTGNMADRDTKEVTMKEIPCQGRDCPDYKGKCKELMNLQFILPEISGLGIWQIDTSSINSIRNVNGAVDLIRSIYGRVRMVPLILALEQIEVVNPDDGKKKNVWVLNIKSTEKMVEAAVKARMEPLKLVESMTSSEELDEIDTLPTPDDERPGLVTPDWEGTEGETVAEGAKRKPEDAARDAEELWPPDGSTATKAKKPVVWLADGVPANIQGFYNWITSHGKKYTRSWFLANFNYNEEGLKDVETLKRAFQEVKEICGWEK